MTGDTAPDRLREAMAGGVRLLHKLISADALLDAVMQLAPALPGRTARLRIGSGIVAGASRGL